MYRVRAHGPLYKAPALLHGDAGGDKDGVRFRACMRVCGQWLCMWSHTLIHAYKGALCTQLVIVGALVGNLLYTRVCRDGCRDVPSLSLNGCQDAATSRSSSVVRVAMLRVAQVATDFLPPEALWAMHQRRKAHAAEFINARDGKSDQVIVSRFNYDEEPLADRFYFYHAIFQAVASLCNNAQRTSSPHGGTMTGMSHICRVPSSMLSMVLHDRCVVFPRMDMVEGQYIYV
jgi:hypothetical protein